MTRIDGGTREQRWQSTYDSIWRQLRDAQKERDHLRDVAEKQATEIGGLKVLVLEARPEMEYQAKNAPWGEERALTARRWLRRAHAALEDGAK